jgi:sugar transferase (PEP-CTERM/EpsH1 system associated)
VIGEFLATTAGIARAKGTILEDRDVVRRPIHIMHLTNYLGFAGAELGIMKLANLADRSRFRVSVCSCRPGDSRMPFARDVSVIHLNRRDGHDWRLVGALVRLLRRERPDILHTHGWATLCEGWLAATLARVPMVVHGEHGTLETRPLNRRLQRWLWSRVDGVLSVSSRIADRMASEIRFPLGKITTIHNGVDLNRFKPRHRDHARERLGLPADRFVIGSAGRMVPVKDHDTLVSALALLQTRGVRVVAVMAGNGPLESHLRQRVQELGLDVRFLGSRPDMEQILPACDVFVSSSTSEGLSNTILEAMATGIPVVATRVGGTDELVEDGHTGLLVPASDPQAMAAAVMRIATEPFTQRAMATRSRERAERQFALDTMVRNYERVYLELVSRRPALANCLA